MARTREYIATLAAHQIAAGGGVYGTLPGFPPGSAGPGAPTDPGAGGEPAGDAVQAIVKHILVLFLVSHWATQIERHKELLATMEQ